ncbi:hypothetical protein AMS69_03050 [Haloarcula rubripromontorii]|uniref:DUF7344 domain-containing protein n=1 Tax=Haloarcula rubripromontorii TaxID=1705562 RepID=A0A0N1IUT6_9EURY|nr:hypothetical protein AMS69_03050 [Haloarcula rubripromontorii]
MGQVGVSRTEKRQLSRDDVYDILSNQRRRYALHAIKQENERAELSDLAEQVAAWENDKCIQDITSTERHRVYTSMQQTHLPTLERAGVITHDNGTVTLTDTADSLDVYLDVVPGDSIPWAEYYLGLAAVSLALVVAIWVGVFPPSIPSLVWPTVITLLFLVSAAYHVKETRRLQLGAADKPPELLE